MCFVYDWTAVDPLFFCRTFCRLVIRWRETRASRSRWWTWGRARAGAFGADSRRARSRRGSARLWDSPTPSSGCSRWSCRSWAGSRSSWSRSSCSARWRTRSRSTWRLETSRLCPPCSCCLYRSAFKSKKSQINKN